MTGKAVRFGWKLGRIYQEYGVSNEKGLGFQGYLWAIFVLSV